MHSCRHSKPKANVGYRFGNGSSPPANRVPSFRCLSCREREVATTKANRTNSRGSINAQRRRLIMLRLTRYAALLAPIVLSSAALMIGGAAAQADQGAPAVDAASTSAGAMSAVEHAKPEAGGRVIKSTHAGPAWPGSTAPAKPEAGGRVITSSDAAAGPAWPGSTAQAKPEAGGRVITATKQVADERATSQRTSAVACTAEATAADRC